MILSLAHLVGAQVSDRPVHHHLSLRHRPMQSRHIIGDADHFVGCRAAFMEVGAHSVAERLLGLTVDHAVPIDAALDDVGNELGLLVTKTRGPARQCQLRRSPRPRRPEARVSWRNRNVAAHSCR